MAFKKCRGDIPLVNGATDCHGWCFTNRNMVNEISFLEKPLSNEFIFKNLSPIIYIEP
jgi:hypothetical protein